MLFSAELVGEDLVQVYRQQQPKYDVYDQRSNSSHNGILVEKLREG